MAIQEIKVRRKVGDIEGDSLRHEAKRTLGIETGEVQTARDYLVEGVSPEQAELLGRKLLADPVIQVFTINEPQKDDSVQSIRVAYKPGVMDPEAHAVMEAAEILGMHPQAVATDWQYDFSQGITAEDLNKVARRLLVNPTVQHTTSKKPETLIIYGETPPVRSFSFSGYSDAELNEYITQERSSLNFAEMNAIRVYSNEKGRSLTDVEVRTIEQTWSEHCGHPTFKGIIIADGVVKKPLIQRIKEASLEQGQLIESAFVDNAGAITAYENQVIVAKGETHNFPVGSAPYEGAMTRSGGLFRDPKGMGEGAECLASIDINCFAPPDLPMSDVPSGCLHPDYLMRHNFRGIRDYGNRMGIPTVSASFFFHRDFRGRCTSLGVVFGIAPKDKCQKKEPKEGQLIISIGGRTGRDGVGGASVSSREMTHQTITLDLIAVQMGNAVEEKKVFDSLTECRDANFIGAVQDCGGGGYSSAIGELAQNVGAEVDLDKIPTKYEGLSAREKWLSESQERMIVAADPQHLEEMAKIFEKHNVEMTVLGKLTGDKKLTLKHKGEVVCDLDMQFLHHGQPQRVMEAHWEAPAKDERRPDLPKDWNETFRNVIGHWNVSSVEPIVRQYDHGVQGITALSPYTGVYEDVLNDGYVCRLIRGKPYGLVAAASFNPSLERINPYWGTIAACTEAVSKFTAVGGNYHEAAMVDNYIWPKPTKQSLGSLDLATDALCDFIRQLKIPCVSGKDSLASTYVGEKKIPATSGEPEKTVKEVIEIPPVLNISVFGRIPDVEKTATLDFKKTGSTICLVGSLDIENAAGSVYYDSCDLVGTNLPKVDRDNLPRVLDKVRDGVQEGKILACSAISRDQPVVVRLAQMCFGGDCGAKVDLGLISDKTRPDLLAYNETAGCFLAEVENPETADEIFAGVPHVVIGKTQERKAIEIGCQGSNLINADIYEAKAIWQEKIKGVIGE